MEKFLEITFYEDNDIQLKTDKYWINKNNVNLFVNGEIEEIFSKSIYEKENFKECMEYIKQKYPNARFVEQGCRSNGWDYKIYSF